MWGFSVFHFSRRQGEARFADERVQAHTVGLAYVPQILQPAPVADLQVSSAPEADPWCLRWGTRDAVLRGGRRFLAAEEPTMVSLTDDLCRLLLLYQKFKRGALEAPSGHCA